MYLQTVDTNGAHLQALAACAYRCIYRLYIQTERTEWLWRALSRLCIQMYLQTVYTNGVALMVMVRTEPLVHTDVSTDCMHKGAKRRRPGAKCIH